MIAGEEKLYQTNGTSKDIMPSEYEDEYNGMTPSASEGGDSSFGGSLENDDIVFRNVEPPQLNFFEWINEHTSKEKGKSFYQWLSEVL